MQLGGGGNSDNSDVIKRRAQLTKKERKLLKKGGGERGEKTSKVSYLSHTMLLGLYIYSVVEQSETLCNDNQFCLRHT